MPLKRYAIEMDRERIDLSASGATGNRSAGASFNPHRGRMSADADTNLFVPLILPRQSPYRPFLMKHEPVSHQGLLIGFSRTGLRESGKVPADRLTGIS